MKTGQSQTSDYPRLSNLIPVPFGIGTIPDPGKWEGMDTVEDVIEMCSAIVDAAEHLEDVEFEWNSIDGWDYLSADEDTISEFCEVWKDTPVTDECVFPMFEEAVLREYQTRPKVFGQYSFNDLVEHWKQYYSVGNGYFVSDSGVVPSHPRVIHEEVEELAS
jgi:hypothetical protein